MAIVAGQIALNNATSVTILVANGSRTYGSLSNTGSEMAFLSLDGGATAGTVGGSAIPGYGIALPPGQVYPLPSGFTGAVSGVCSAGQTGVTTIGVTELP